MIFEVFLASEISPEAIDQGAPSNRLSPTDAAWFDETSGQWLLEFKTLEDLVEYFMERELCFEIEPGGGGDSHVLIILDEDEMDVGDLSGGEDAPPESGLST